MEIRVKDVSMLILIELPTTMQSSAKIIHLHTLLKGGAMKASKLALVRFETREGSNFRRNSHQHQWVFNAPEINMIFLLQDARAGFGLRAEAIDSNGCVILANKWRKFSFSDN